VSWAEQQREILRVKRDFVHDKREEERAYREARYDDENWSRQWYLVRRFSVLRHIFSHGFVVRHRDSLWCFALNFCHCRVRYKSHQASASL